MIKEVSVALKKRMPQEAPSKQPQQTWFLSVKVWGECRALSSAVLAVEGFRLFWPEKNH